MVSLFYDLDKSMEEYILKKAVEFRVNYGKECGFLENVKSWFAENLSGALGRGAAATFPDRPCLVWQFEYRYHQQSHGAGIGIRFVRDVRCSGLYDCEFPGLNEFVGWKRNGHPQGVPMNYLKL
jgi:hypothetical protein